MIKVFNSLYNSYPIQFLVEKQLIRFLITGGSAAVISAIIMFMCVELLHFKPIDSIIPAYVIGFNVSYFGHRYWTFSNETQHSHKKSMIRLLITALIGYFITRGSMALLYTDLHIYYMLAFVIASVVAACFSFLSGKFWAFS